MQIMNFLRALNIYFKNKSFTAFFIIALYVFYNFLKFFIIKSYIFCAFKPSTGNVTYGSSVRYDFKNNF